MPPYCSWMYKLFGLEGQGGFLLFVYVCRSYNNMLYADVFEGNVTQVSLRFFVQFLYTCTYAPGRWVLLGHGRRSTKLVSHMS